MPSDWYSRPEGYMQQLQADFISGRYEQMWKSTAKALFDGRIPFNGSPYTCFNNATRLL